MIHPDDAALIYDGAIPAAVRAQFDSRAPRMFKSDAPQLPRIVPKPAAVRARMVQVMASYAERGGLGEQDLQRAGFSDAEIAEHKGEAMRLMLFANPALLTLEMPA